MDDHLGRIDLAEAGDVQDLEYSGSSMGSPNGIVFLCWPIFKSMALTGESNLTPAQSRLAC